ncbi:MAG: hypothetical protein JNL96_23955 [Planctomycetaceae bacterium]|nr:hypothetical protein [Planctomycetaceae bacterium]
MLRSFAVALLAALSLVAFATTAQADDDFFVVPLRDLELTEGKWNTADPDEASWRTTWRRREIARPYVVVQGAGEGYWSHPNDVINLTGDVATWGSVAVRRPHTEADVVGTFFYPLRDYSRFESVKFKIPAAKAAGDRRDDFLEAKIGHYSRLQNQNLPGAAWFRHQVRSATLERYGKIDDETRNRNNFSSFQPWNNLDDTFSLFAGSRAISENLQLDRVLPAARADETQVRLADLKGITIDEIDWSRYLEGKQPKLDKLAAYVPADQHVVFFPTFDAAMKLADEAELQGTPLLEAAEPQSQDYNVVGRYQRQIGLKTTALGRMLGPQVINSVAVTGGDPYFRIGTDLAVIFEARDVTTLKTMLLGQITLNTSGEKNLSTSQGQVIIDGHAVDYQEWRTPDRAISSYMAAYGDVVAVTNSLVQLKRLVETHQGGPATIASLPEYKFFRERYKLGDAGETAFVFISDPTIRRWCSPRWRIGDSRRMRDVAVLSELQAEHLPELAAGDVKPQAIRTDLRLSVSGDVALGVDGVYAKSVGSLNFMTPINELPLEHVTKSEADAYDRWRDGYQRNFSWAFDPIGLRFTIDDAQLAADLTVMPLIDNTEYRDLIAISRGSKLAPTSGDPHGAPFHVALAINKESARLKEWAGIASSFVPQLKVDPLSWLGDSVAFYVDASPLWGELEKLKTDKEREEFFKNHVSELPVAVRFDVSSAFKATAFLAGVRGFIEGAGPGMTSWETREVDGESYVRIAPTAKAVRADRPESKIAVYYALTADSLTITLSEDLIKQSLARSKRRAAPSAEQDATKPSDAAIAWLGENLCLEMGDLAIQALAIISRDEYRTKMQTLSWGNLPTLNEWRRLYPNQDPLKLHERLWGAKLLCPGGGEYVWNEKWQTMESSVYGNPAEPKPGPDAPPQIKQFQQLRFGLTFEEQGLRARGQMVRRK